MTTEIDIVKQAIEEYNTANKLRKINQITYEHMLDSIRWIMQYCEKNKIPLPRSQLLAILDSSNLLIDDNNEVVRNIKKHGDLVIQKLEQVKPTTESLQQETQILKTDKIPVKSIINRKVTGRTLPTSKQNLC